MVAKRKQKHNEGTAKTKIKFEHRLVLTNWMLELFGVATFEDLGKHMRDPAFEVIRAGAPVAGDRIHATTQIL